jgi:hypothetical protein
MPPPKLRQKLLGWDGEAGVGVIGRGEVGVTPVDGRLGWVGDGAV